MGDEKDQLTDHNYDGILEYDNPLPNWWLLTFMGTIIFAFLYWLHYEIAGGPTLSQQLEAAMHEIETIQAHAPRTKLSEQQLLEKIKGADLNGGAAIFQSRCQACHGDHLQGVIGPNLTDEFWIHGQGTAADIGSVIHQGVTEKGMPAWDGLLSEDEIINVTALILSKQNSHPPGAKPPQGEKAR